MADPNHLGPQPDTDRMIQSGYAFFEELVKFPNIPALAEGNIIQNSLAHIITQIQHLTTQTQQLTTQTQQFITQTNERFERVDQRFDQLDNKIDTLASRVIANDKNSVARVQNSHLSTPTQRLAPLVNPSTDTPIEEFPARPQDISTMQIQTLVSVLQELGLSTSGGREAKEKRFRQHIGLRPEQPRGA
ncbi:hypothetical protein PV04_07207 [Phialophora macrospora]|uniref:SAP domain-containing protein n=1 Tax=Phialophora macrospora TaxID=1851006 RepID=A0A0D2FA62_9EURO|nr:hypothetical protein PV04_07207 [Phialophora macrospora]